MQPAAWVERANPCAQESVAPTHAGLHIVQPNLQKYLQEAAS